MVLPDSSLLLLVVSIAVFTAQEQAHAAPIINDRAAATPSSSNACAEARQALVDIEQVLRTYQVPFISAAQTRTLGTPFDRGPSPPLPRPPPPAAARTAAGLPTVNLLSLQQLHQASCQPKDKVPDAHQHNANNINVVNVSRNTTANTTTNTTGKATTNTTREATTSGKHVRLSQPREQQQQQLLARHKRSSTGAPASEAAVQQCQDALTACHNVSEAVTCEFSKAIACQCTSGPAASLTITIDEWDVFPQSHSAQECFRNTSALIAPCQLVVAGQPFQQILEGILHTGEWVNLRELHISGFTERYLDPSTTVAELPLLEVLDMSGNFLDDLEPDTGRAFTLPSLVALDLSDNLLSQLPRALLAAGNASLVTVDLSGNAIATFNAPDTALENLKCLNVSNSLVQSLDAGAGLSQFPRVASLDLSFNALTSIPDTSLSSVLEVVTANFSNNRLTEVPPRVFQHWTKLSTLNLASNEITEIPATPFPPSVSHLYLQNNNITRLHADALSGLEYMVVLALDHNRITSVPAGMARVFDIVTLVNLYLNDNRISSLPNGTTLGLYVQIADFSHNRLTRLDRFSTGGAYHLYLSFNNLTHVDMHIPPFWHRPQLQLLDLSDNPHLHKLPPLNTQLEALIMRNHRIPVFNLTQLVSLTRLAVLDLDVAPGFHSEAVIGPSALRSWTLPTQALNLAGMALPATVVQKLQLSTSSLNLQSLHLGWPGFGTSVSGTTACDMLAPKAQELMLIHTAFTKLDVCPLELDMLFLMNNPELRELNVFSKLKRLNVSGCPHLTSLSVPSVPKLDISGTSLVPTPRTCVTEGTEMLLARNMRGQGFAVDGPTHAALARCLASTAVLDLSDNLWLDDPQLLMPTAKEVVTLSNVAHADGKGRTLPTRASPQLLVLANTPIACTLQLTGTPATTDTSLVQEMTLGYAFSCDCAPGFELHESGRCSRKTTSYVVVAAGSAVGGAACVLLTLLVARCVVRARSYRRSLQEDNQRQHVLLIQRAAEVEALKKAWEIEFDELRMIKRVAAGAFGVVFKAEWDTVTVAVKVMQESVMLMDESTEKEFEKEVEFLQKTRHPNVVRFFGAGRDPTSHCPFLVLEYVAMGSLKDLLQQNMEQVLRSRPRAAVEAGDGAVDTVWDLKLQLLQDVTSGMAFIHGLGHAHRDLKSGNVLVSAHLRAKITDFGSIRECLTRPVDATPINQRPRGGNDDDDDDDDDDDNNGGNNGGGRRGATSGPVRTMTMTAGVGTPLYMAPEVLAGGRYDTRADVFSFGVLMWEVATQRVPDLVAQEKGSGYRGPLLSTLSNLLDEGKRLSYQGHVDVPQWYQDLSLTCMAQSATSRPTFEDLSHGSLSPR
ncbi:TKL protein kinase [Salpingoeca rosetta]|uniref:non-specific serine/threonine protein kinase n=1 Tax=Salpingoeca rosetta (strain ATCC 50818 / BSB-021) TaxID=946362 RepID=F2UAD9_SALR5|nr:TKL protein kinase [Salpingoeca rosetta]EGD73714.1 TKL protein kinase [Salpingoeca rosetta]|eukprot:XP_004993995.1 TKL protein kinase [Salpingoeca rosetta]